MTHSGSPYQSDDIPDLADVTGLHEPHHTPEQAEAILSGLTRPGTTVTRTEWQVRRHITGLPALPVGTYPAESLAVLHARRSATNFPGIPVTLRRREVTTTHGEWEDVPWQ